MIELGAASRYVGQVGQQWRLKDIQTNVPHRRKGVPVINPPKAFNYAITELCFDVGEAFGDQRQQKIGERAPPRNQKPGFAFHQRNIGRYSARHHIDTPRKLDFIEVGVPHGHVEHGGGAPAETRRYVAFVKVNGTQHFGRENREQPKHVRGVEDGRFVEQNQVLVGGATPNINAVAGFAHARYARQRL